MVRSKAGEITCFRIAVHRRLVAWRRSGTFLSIHQLFTIGHYIPCNLRAAGWSVIMSASKALGEASEGALAFLKFVNDSADAFGPLKSAAGGALHIAELVKVRSSPAPNFDLSHARLAAGLSI